jgi:hypothetical protein
MDESLGAAIEVAVRWWIAQLRQGGLPSWVDEHFGNPRSRLLAYRKLHTAPPTEEQLTAFATALRTRLRRATRPSRRAIEGAGGSVAAAPLVLLQTDYGPVGILQQLGEKTGIAPEAFPWKIAMSVQPGRVELQPGPSVHYPRVIVLYDVREDEMG